MSAKQGDLWFALSVTSKDNTRTALLTRLSGRNRLAKKNLEDFF